MNTPEPERGRERAEEPAEPDAPGVTPDESDGSHDARESAESDALRAAVESVADGWDDSAERIEARKAAARAVLDYAREHGGVSKQEAKEQVYPEYPVADQNPRTWYRKNVRPVLKEVAEYQQASQQWELTE